MDNKGRTALFHCLHPTNRHIKCLDFLLECGADPNTLVSILQIILTWRELNTFHYTNYILILIQYTIPATLINYCIYHHSCTYCALCNTKERTQSLLEHKIPYSHAFGSINFSTFDINSHHVMHNNSTMLYNNSQFDVFHKHVRT